MKVESLSPHFQIELTKQGRMDHMVILVETSGAGDGVSGAGILSGLIKDNVGVSVEVRVGGENSVPRSQGKAVRVIDNRDKV